MGNLSSCLNGAPFSPAFHNPAASHAPVHMPVAFCPACPVSPAGEIYSVAGEGIALHRMQTGIKRGFQACPIRARLH